MSQKNKRREQILEAALGVIARHGMRKTTMEDIADAAHMRAASLYYYFKSKEEVFSAALRELGNSYLSASRRAVEAVESGREKFTVYLEKRQQAEAEMGANFDVTSEVVIELMPLVREATTELLASDRELITEILHKGIDDGSFELDDVESMVVTLQASFMGTNALCKTGDFEADVVLPTRRDVFIRGLLKRSCGDEGGNR